jgi:hypothetical protein
VGRHVSAVLLIALAASPHAHAQVAPAAEDGGDAATPSSPEANRLNLRLGSATSDSTGRPTICLDVRVAAGFGVESCGTGQGILHDEQGAELAHFRATFSFLSRATPSGTGRLRAGVGWAELQVGVDHAGFRFNTPDIERGSVAGPEAALQGQWLVPLAKGVEAIASVTAGAAVFANADQLVVPKSNVQPFVSFELGLGW